MYQATRHSAVPLTLPRYPLSSQTGSRTPVKRISLLLSEGIIIGETDVVRGAPKR